MSDFYIDHGAYTSALGTTPIWGVPQEGDGSSKDAATASSIATITFGSVPTTGAVSLCGASVATTGVIGAATTAAAATALAANINAAVTAVSTTFANTGVPTNASRLQNIVYARVNPGDATQVQVMARIGSALYNTTCWGVSLDGSPTLTQFSGGSGGCWGWLVNPAAIGVSGGVAALAYGIAVAMPTIYACVPTNETPIWVRTGANPVIVVGGTVSRGNVPFLLRLVFDTNTQWTGDSATGTVTIRYSGSADFFFYPSASGVSTSTAQWECVRQSNCVIAMANSGSSKGFYFGPSGHSHITLKGLMFVIESGASARFIHNYDAYGSHSARYFGCTFDATAIITTTLPANLFTCSLYQNVISAYFNACSFKWSLNGSPPDGVALCGANPYDLKLVFVDCSFSSGTSAKLKVFEQTTNSGLYQLQVIRCSGVYTSSNYTGEITASSFTYTPTRYAFHSAAADREFRIDSPAGCVRWSPTASPAFPTLAALLPSGSPWSIAAEWSSITDIIGAGSEFQLPSLTQVSRGAVGVKTITLKFLCPSAITNATLASSFYVAATWVQTNNVQKSIYSMGAVNGSDTWTGASGYATHTSREVTITTDTSVQQYTDVSVLVGFTRSCPAGGTSLVFFDPEFTIT